MRALAYSLIAFAAVATQGARADWSSRELVKAASHTFNVKLDVFLVVLQSSTPTATLDDAWKAVRQQTDALEALLDTGATFLEVEIQCKRLGTALMDARRLMWAEGLTYHPTFSARYQAVRLAYRRLERNMHGLPILY